MATSVELSEGIAEALGIPSATVLLHMRHIREAGLLTMAGRGRSAAKMTAKDASHLLIAVAGSSYVRESVETVQAYAGLLAEGSRSANWPVNGLTRNHSFADALTELIQGVASMQLQRANDFAFYVELRGPRPEALIEGAIHVSGERRYIPRAGPIQRDAAFAGDLETRRRFSNVTIRILGELIRS